MARQASCKPRQVFARGRLVCVKVESIVGLRLCVSWAGSNCVCVCVRSGGLGVDWDICNAKVLVLTSLTNQPSLNPVQTTTTDQKP